MRKSSETGNAYCGVKSTLKKILVCLALLGLLTACWNGQNEAIPSITGSSEPELVPTQTEGAAPTPHKLDRIESDPKNDESSLNANGVADAASLIPAGWHILESHAPVKAEGDLNKDGIPDMAIIIEKTEDSIEASRSLLIAFGTKEQTYLLSILAEHVILSESEGGVFGDPFDSMEIDRGSVVVSDYGGSNVRWYHKYRFRFQDNDWYLIGATTGTNYLISDAIGMGNSEDDYNLLTGDFIKKKTNEQGEVEITKGNRGKKQLIKLREFDSRDISDFLML
jgi:hypothetical protein